MSIASFQISPSEMSFWGWLMILFIPACVLSTVVFYCLSLPLRRQQRARFLLDIIESALTEGEPIERRIISLSRTRDPAIGARFHLLAAYLESGMTFIPALEKTRGLVPPQILAMLKIGATTGNIANVLPACAKLLQDGLSHTRAAINYQVVFALVLNPIIFIGPTFFSIKIAPVFNEITTSLSVTMPSHTLTDLIPWLLGLQLLLIIALYRGALFYLGGPGFGNWLESGTPKYRDWFLYHIPWRRKRLQRDFSGMLGLLLDSGLPEAQAVTLAAASTTNAVFIRNAAKAVEQLQAGAKLTDAIHFIDHTGEFRWRLANAAHVSSNFFRALQGWHDSLDSSAFQQEQAAAQTISTIMVLLNASVVFITALSIFQSISAIGAAPIQ